MPLRNRVTSSVVGLAWFGPALLTTVFIAALGMLLWFMQHRADTEARRNLSRDAGSTRTTVQTRLDSTQDFLMLLTDEQVRGTLDAATFQERVSQYVIDHPELINVTWADADFVIRWTAPYEPNKQLVGLALTLPEPKRASHLARDTGLPAYTRPFVVIQGTLAVEVYVPVFRDGHFLGTFAGVYSLEGLLQYSLSVAIKSRYHVELLDERGSELAALSTMGALNPDVAATIPLTPPLDGVVLRLTSYQSGWAWEQRLLALLTIGLAAGMGWSMWALNRDAAIRRQALATVRESETYLQLLLTGTLLTRDSKRGKTTAGGIT